MIVGVIGSDGRIGQKQEEEAESVGRILGERGIPVVCGGLGGVMEAVCRGAKSAGGLTIGILPGKTKDEANQYVDISIVTGMSIARNVVIVRTADVLIAIGGRFGTLSEIAHALSTGKKVISLGSWELLKDHQLSDKLIFAETPEEAVNLALRIG